MTEIDPLTGLPKELEVFEGISKEHQHITVTLEKRRYGKPYTVIRGVEGKGIDVKEISRALKNRFACGGTAKNGTIELQGNYIGSITGALAKLGFEKENIEIA